MMTLAAVSRVQDQQQCVLQMQLAFQKSIVLQSAALQVKSSHTPCSWNTLVKDICIGEKTRPAALLLHKDCIKT
jgi:hypothetical protein